MRKEGVNFASIEKCAFMNGDFSPTRTSARAESWDEIPLITLRRNSISSITRRGDLAIVLGDLTGPSRIWQY